MENKNLDPLGIRKQFPARIPKKNLRSPPNENFFQHGKIPPQAIDLEEVVLGALMLENKRISDVRSFLKPEHMYKEAHQIILSLIYELNDEGAPFDLLIVTDKARKNGVLELVGGPYYITMLTNRVASSENTEYHARLVQQQYLKRELIRIGSELVRDGYEDTKDVFELIEHGKECFKLLDIEKESFTTSARHVVKELIQIQDTDSEIGNKLAAMFRYETQWPSINRFIIIGPRKFLLMAGGAKHGKTKFSEAMIYDMLERYPRGISVFWATFEDSSKDIIYGYIATKLKIKPKALQTGKFDKSLKPAVSYWANRFAKFDVHFLDKAKLVKKIMEQYKTFCSMRPDTLNILIVDNIMGLLDKNEPGFKHNPNAFYDYAIGEIALGIENQNAFVIALHHYNDEQEDPANLKIAYRPRLKNIKGTEASRRKPHYVLLINNPAKYPDLMSEYQGDQKKLLKDLYIVEVGADRDDDNVNEDSIIRFYKTLDFNIFMEIDKTVSEEEEMDENEDETAIDPALLVGGYSEKEPF